jgi:hypothetical protein
MQEINTSNFVQATEYEMYMYTKVGGLALYEFL